MEKKLIKELEKMTLDDALKKYGSIKGKIKSTPINHDKKDAIRGTLKQDSEVILNEINN